ncbi:hypothetical protein PAXINDRAFT_172732, partial [Paxillus involutus ATCC 200175]
VKSFGKILQRRGGRARGTYALDDGGGLGLQLLDNLRWAYVTSTLRFSFSHLLHGSPSFKLSWYALSWRYSTPSSVHLPHPSLFRVFNVSGRITRHLIHTLKKDDTSPAVFVLRGI